MAERQNEFGRKALEIFSRILANLQGRLHQYLATTQEGESKVGTGWKHLVTIGVGDCCELPDCEDPVEAVILLANEEDPSIQTAIRICAEHLAEVNEDRAFFLASQAPWN